MDDEEPLEPGPRPRLARCVVAVLVLASFPLLAGEPAESLTPGAVRRRSDRSGLETWRRDQALRQRAIAYLVARARQSRDGGIGSQYPVATTSLVGLALLGGGIQPDQEPYDTVLRRGVEFLLARMGREGFINETDYRLDAESGSRMHGHCYALLFLTQIVGALPLETDRRVARAIQRGVDTVERAQTREGGWWYTPTGRDAAGQTRDEASVTICAIQALRAARNAGFDVDAARIRRAVQYVKRCQNPDGSFRYSLSDGVDRSTFALTAAAVSTLNAAGVYRSENLRRGLDFLEKSLGGAGWRAERAIEDRFFYYGTLYTAQALFQEGGRSWGRWFEPLRERVIETLESPGDTGPCHWRCRYGNEYATAVVLLVLELPVGYLPIFQR